MSESKKIDKPLFDPYRGKKLDDTKEELNSSNKKLAPDDMVSMLNTHKKSGSARKRKVTAELVGDLTPTAPYMESPYLEEKPMSSDFDKREQMHILTIVEGKAMSLWNMFNKRLMEKDINKMTENLALMGRSVMRLDESQGDSFFLCVAREMAIYQDDDWDMCIGHLRKQLANYIDKNEFAQVLQMIN